MNRKGIDLIEELLALVQLQEQKRKRLELPEGAAVEIAPVALEKFPAKIKEVVGSYCQTHGTKIHHWTVEDESCYYFDNDRVYLLKGKDHELQVRMLLHELAHSTGHPDRLNRRGIGCASARATAYEEVIADSTARLLLQQFGLLTPYLTEMIDNYLDHYLDQIFRHEGKSKSTVLAQMLPATMAAACYILGRPNSVFADLAKAIEGELQQELDQEIRKIKIEEREEVAA